MRVASLAILILATHCFSLLLSVLMLELLLLEHRDGLPESPQLSLGALLLLLALLLVLLESHHQRRSVVRAPWKRIGLLEKGAHRRCEPLEVAPSSAGHHGRRWRRDRQRVPR